MTQPLMYNLIEAKRSVRTLYLESLVGRGDITREEFDAANVGFQNRLESAFTEVHEAMIAAPELPTRPVGIGTTASDHPTRTRAKSARPSKAQRPVSRVVAPRQNPAA